MAQHRLRSVGCAPPRKVEHRAGRETVFAAGYPTDHRRRLIEFEKAAARNLRQHIGNVFFAHLVEDPGSRDGWRDAIDRDIKIGQLFSK